MLTVENCTSKYNKLAEYLGEKCSKPSISFLSMVIYKLLFDIIYLKCIAGTYPFFYLYIQPLNAVNGWLAFLLIGTTFNYKFYKQNSSSSLILTVFNMIYFIPITAYCSYSVGSSSFLFFAIIYWALLSYLQYKIPIYYGKQMETHLSDKIIYVIMILVSVLSIYVWVRYSNFRIHLNLLDVYGIRAEAAKNAFPSILSYAFNLTSIIIPMLMVLMLHKRKYLFLIWLLFLTLINFSYAGMKTVILFPIILIGGYIFYRNKMISLIFPLGILLEIVAILENIFGSGLIVTMFFRRLGMVLASISEYFYRFFLSNPTDLFRSSIIGKLGFDSIYSRNIPFVIGDNYMTQVVSANNGLMADVWSGLGFIGLIVMPIILICIFRVLDYVSYGINQRLTVGLILYYAIIFTNSSWSTILITHGFIVMCIMFILFPKDKQGVLQ